MSTKVTSFDDEMSFDNKVWKVVFINNEQTNYCISQEGEVYNYRRKEFKKHINHRGYPAVQLSVKCKSVMCDIHRMVALAFIPNPEPLTRNCVDHINGDTSDFRLSNLEWVTKAENTKRAYNIGLHKPSAKPFKLIKDGVIYTVENATHFAKEHGLHQSNLAKVHTGKNKHTGGFYLYTSTNS